CLSCKKNNKQDERATESSKYINSFHSSISDAKDAETAILLLQSENKFALLTAIQSLSKYANKSKDNAKILFDLGIVNNVLPIIEHEDIFVRRFAGKLLTEMAVVPDVINDLIESNCIGHFTKLLMREEDIFMQEYLSAVLAKLSEDPYGNALLANHLNASILFERFQSPDPDIKKHNLEILHNLMHDPIAAYEISKSKKFNFSALYQHFESSYPEIQHLALDVTADLIGRNKDKDIQSLFHETNGVKMLLDFLKNDEWNDLHVKALNILRFAAENPVVVDELIESGSIPQILYYIKHMENPKLFIEALRILVHVANTFKGRKILYSHEIIECLIDALRQPIQSDIVEVTCYIIGKMTLFDHAARELASTESIKTILDLLKKEDLQWSTRHAANLAIKQLLMSNITNCNIFSNIHGPDYLWQMLKHSIEQVPVETCIVALEVLLAMARHLTFRDTMINFDTIDTICLLLESTYPFVDEFKIACCKLLSALCLEESGRHYFLKAKGFQRIFTFITDAYSVSVRNATLQLIQAISTDLTVAKFFVENKYLLYMLNNRLSSKTIPLWDTCIEILLKSHLPTKFALTGRLPLHDLTQNGFYVSKTNICPSPILDDIFRIKFCSLEPIYVVNYLQLSTSNTLQNEITFERDINAWLESNFGRLQCDPHFSEYVELFKRMLLAKESKDVPATERNIDRNIQYVLSRAKMLAVFVARQMSGVDSAGIRYIDQQLEVHLKQIKKCLETNMIPLGQLRVGSYLERAMLFKAIADRICLPTAFVRGEYGVSWIEIAIPQMENSNEEGLFDAHLDENNEDYEKRIMTELLGKSNVFTYQNGHEREKISLSRNYQSTIYPTKLMKPNFIVDLMDTPGDLIPIGSPRSKVYTILY
ncbi:Armadillo repeat-containing protein 3, partial [Acromyrmex echinatior]